MVSTQGSNQGNGAGHMKINRQFNKIALGNLTLGSGSVTTIELFDFDNSTGVVSNPMILNYNFGVGNIYGLEFSPDGKVLYVSELLTRLVQYDLTQPTALAIENSAFQLSSNFYQAAALQLGKDDKIYINAGTIDVINCPNKLGTSCGFQQNVITGQSGGGGYGLPKWVYYESDAPIPTTNSIVKTGNCIGLPVSFSLQNTSNIVSVSWDFGDPASGTINNTSSSLTPQHTYNTAGTYTVNVVINYPCYTETIPLTFTIDAATIPTFNTIPTLCIGDTAPILPSNSSNGITGTWNPTTISTSSSGTATYTFTPNAGQCASVIPITITINPLVTPTFNPIPVLCIGGTAPVLPTTSLNGITGTWNPTTISTSISGTATYTFTPNAGQCANVIPIILTVDPLVTPTFNPFPSLCVGDTAPILPSNSSNGITGTWNPSTISTSISGMATYTFTPNAGQCANVTPIPIIITVNPLVTPTFNPIPVLCIGGTAPVLPTTSLNGITGTWNPTTISTSISGTATYTFTPNAGQCANVTPIPIIITVDPLITPTFNPISPLCNGDTAPVLPSTSLNGITGTWNPTIVSNTSSGTYTFTPNVVVGQCYSPTDINITVLPQLVPDFQDLTLCENQVGYVLNNQSPNGIIGTWSPATINFTTGGNYTFTPDAGQCASPQTILVTINSSSLTDFQWIVSEPFSGNPTITIIPNSPGNYLYQLDFGPLQTSNIFQNVSSGFHTVQVTDANGCSDTIEKKDILIADYPKFFTPNGDDYNDTWNIKGLSGLPNAKIYIFDRYGKLIKQISSTGQGWDGTYNSQQLPSDDYWFVVEFEFNNTMKLFKSHFTLKR